MASEPEAGTEPGTTMEARPVRLMIGAQIVNGVFAYAFLALASRRLGETGFAPLSVAWSAMFLVGTGCFLPVEQQLGRHLARRRDDRSGAWGVIRQSLVTTARWLVVLAVVGIVVGPWAVDELFDGRTDVFVGLSAAVVGFAMLHAARGMAAGLSRLRLWSALFVIEGVARVAAAGVLVVLDRDSAGTMTWAAALGSLFAAVTVIVWLATDRPRDVTPFDGPSFRRGSVALLASSLLTSLLISAGPLTIAALATPSEETITGPFLTGLVIARTPVLMFPAILSLLLPAMAAAVYRGDLDGFRSRVRRIQLVTLAAAAVAGVGALVAGPTVVSILFGEEFALLGGWDLAALGFSSMLLVGALGLAQAAVAGDLELQVVGVWATAAAAYVGGLLVVDDLLKRVELALVISSVMAFAGVVRVLSVYVRSAASVASPAVG